MNDFVYPKDKRQQPPMSEIEKLFSDPVERKIKSQTFLYDDLISEVKIPVLCIIRKKNENRFTFPQNYVVKTIDSDDHFLHISQKELVQKMIKEFLKNDVKSKMYGGTGGETKSEMKNETKSETKNQTKSETKDETKSETKNEMKNEMKNETKSDGNVDELLPRYVYVTMLYTNSTTRPNFHYMTSIPNKLEDCHSYLFNVNGYLYWINNC